ncbi:ArsR/SmtB family transcription factor [Enterococcus rivorum]|uniref:HTH arsR-type domain-containing protein n=1 Tax=Enterococcus rivorum TaxID=762845 RepID=A0A1E5KWV7_9ENTE|nr:metalloregulator ArsR/SmtB family transcription factor [Enterococcus rivorum]MBP2097294.1 DNA-binding transcriptional ArsR family regulator [Enterococcus rivorum]OEH82355.1 hypothetical protein BCR26_02685 [Enterococcus rivorum]
MKPIKIEQSYVYELVIAASCLVRGKTEALNEIYSEKELNAIKKQQQSFLDWMKQTYHPMLFFLEFFIEIEPTISVADFFDSFEELTDLEIQAKIFPTISTDILVEKNASEIIKNYSVGFKNEKSLVYFLENTQSVIKDSKKLLTALDTPKMKKKVKINEADLAETKQWISYLLENKKYIETLRVITGKPLPKFKEAQHAYFIPSFLYHIPVIVFSEDLSKQLTFFPVTFAKAEEVAISRQRAVQTLKVLADETRLEMIELLLTRLHTGKELADLLKIRPATVSHHIQQVREAGLLFEYREGNIKLFGINKRVLRQVQDYLENMKMPKL